MKKSDFNILLFLLLFFLLKYGFYIYVGFTTPGGRLYFSFLAKYVNVPYWLTVMVAKLSKLLVEAGGYSVYQKDAANITISGSRGVTLAWGCLGAAAISLWIAFIAAHRAKIKFKIKWMIAGVVLIFMVNIMRIAMIALANHLNWKYFQSFNAHTSFDIITYIIILIMMMVFVLRYNRLKKRVSSGSV